LASRFAMESVSPMPTSSGEATGSAGCAALDPRLAGIPCALPAVGDFGPRHREDFPVP
jgi:hypothetical protein